MKYLLKQLLSFLLIIIFLPGLLNADILKLQDASGVTVFEGVLFDGLKHQGGKTTFYIRLSPEDEAHEVEAERIVELIFQNGSTPGRYFDIKFAGLPENQIVVQSSKVLSFSNMTLYAVAPGQQQAQPVGIKLISAMIEGVTPIPTPVPLARPVDDSDEFLFSTDEVELDLSGIDDQPLPPTSLTGGTTVEDAINQYSAPLEEQGVGGYEVNTQYGSSDFQTELTSAEKNFLAGLGALFIAVLFIVIVIALFNIIVFLWMLVDAIQNGEWAYVIGMIVFCGGLPSLIYLYSKYNGPAARILKIAYAVAYVPLVIMYAIAVAFGG
ncbi:MAG: hypothetical protein ACFCU1_04020 [Sumerlaeia bacterium]